MKKTINTIVGLITSIVLIIVSVFVCSIVVKPTKVNNLTEQEKQAGQRSIRAVNIYYASAEEENNTEAYDVMFKGGSICLVNQNVFTMTGGTISNHKTKFGGAVYIGSGSVFTMDGGTITNCEAEFGGAIYIAAGGTCNIKGNSVISQNKARYAPAIYAEAGAILNISDDVVIDDNSVLVENGLTISTETLTVGNSNSGLSMHYAEFGTYPQTFVGTDMNTALETWYTENSSTLTSLNTYTAGMTSDMASDMGYASISAYMDYREWKTYEYTDGNVYARGISLANNDSFTYQDGTAIVAKGSVAWFKVEPIKWLILNYDAFMAGTDSEMELMSYMALSAQNPFYPNAADTGCNLWVNSYLRDWLNGNFYNTAFTGDNQQIISLTTVKNNVTGNYSAASSDGTGTETSDFVYCSSYYEISQMFNTLEKRLCSPTDFALCNRSGLSTSYSTAVRAGTCNYWTRSAGKGSNQVCSVLQAGTLHYQYDPAQLSFAVRPTIRLVID